MTESLVEVAEYGNRPEAELAASLLETHGIYAVLQADDCGGFYASQTYTIGVRVMVAQHDYFAAKAVLDNPADYTDDGFDEGFYDGTDDSDVIEAQDEPGN